MSEIQTKSVKKDNKVNLQYMRDKDREPVKGIFRFYEVPGGELSFSMRLYKGDQVENYTFKDGEVKTTPLGVAKHLNKNLWYPEYSFVKSEDMQNVAQVTKKVRRASFQSLEFMDIEDLNDDSPIPSVAAGV